MLSNIRNLFSDDPVVRVGEFEGAFYIDPCSDLFRRLLLFGKYEPYLAEVVKGYIRPDADAIDIGANIGFFTVLFAKRVSPHHRVLAVEPTLGAIKRLRKNLQTNSVSSKVVVFDGAISNYNGTADIDVVDGHEEYSSIGGIAHPKMVGKPVHTISIECATLDSLVEMHGLKPGIVKIDVEGNEHLVISGAKRTIEMYQPVVIMELVDSLLNKHNSSVKDVISQCASLGYVATGVREQDTESISNYIFLPR